MFPVAPQAPLILTALLLFVYLVHAISAGAMGHVDLVAISIAIFYTLFFSTSFYTALLILQASRSRSRLTRIYCVPTRFSYLMLIVLSLCFFYSYFSTMPMDYSNFINFRASIIDSFRSEGSALYLRTANTLGILMFFTSSLIYIFRRKHSFLFVFVALSYPILFTNRNFVLVLVIFVLYRLIAVEKSRLSLVYIPVSFFFLNSFYIFAFAKADLAEGFLVATMWSLLEYIALPLHGLSFSLEYSAYYGEMLTLPASVASALGFEVSRDFIYSPPPNQTNVYTLFFGVFYDFGWLGIVIFACLFGVFHSFLYFKSTHDQFYLFLYLFSLYPLLMTVFDNVYTTSGLWLYAIIPFLFFRRVKYSAAWSD